MSDLTYLKRKSMTSKQMYLLKQSHIENNEYVCIPTVYSCPKNIRTLKPLLKIYECHCTKYQN